MASGDDEGFQTQGRPPQLVPERTQLPLLQLAAALQPLNLGRGDGGVVEGISDGKIERREAEERTAHLLPLRLFLPLLRLPLPLFLLSLLLLLLQALLLQPLLLQPQGGHAARRPRGS